MISRGDAARVGDGMKGVRREIHQEPEVGLHLPQTQHRILTELRGLPLEVSIGRDLSSVTAVLRGRPTGRAVLLRADMDALPIEEQSGLPFASRVPGVSHACGHDLHVAMLTGAAKLLCEARERLMGDVVFMFQPGEEGIGGGRLMVQEGVLEAAGVPLLSAFAVHVFSGVLPHGHVATRPGTMMAASDLLDVRVVGQGGHGAIPHMAKDPVPVACEMVLALQTMTTRAFDVFDPVVVTIGTMHAGAARNVIPDSVEFAGSVRSFSKEAQSSLQLRILRLLEHIAQAHGVQAEVDYTHAMPPLLIDPHEASVLRAVAGELFGENRVRYFENPLVGSEDFAFVLERVPGAYAALGAGPPGVDPGACPMNHSPRVVFDDGLLVDGCLLYANYALRRLAGSAAS
jgi:amidohydrolase